MESIHRDKGRQAMLEEKTFTIRLTVLGARGSVPVSGSDFTEYGCATSCYLVEADGRTIFLDAGTGMLNVPGRIRTEEPMTLLLSHTHMDHILGLPLFPPLMQRDCRLDIYGATRGGLSVEAQLKKFLEPPLWPVWLDEMPARTVIHELKLPMDLGAVHITGMESNHPNGSTIYRLSIGGKSLVYATDYEHSDDSLRELTAFSEGTDLLLYDGQYSEEEYARSRGFGHSTVETGLKVLRESGAGRLLLVHHDPRRTDGMLRELERKYGSDRVLFAKEGDVITI